MDLPDFQRVVDATVETLPQQFRDAIEGVSIVVEALPPAHHARTRGLLLGLYEGVPITSWGRDYSGKLPDKISLFKDTIEAYARTPEEVPFVIRETLLHEIAHHFGFDHDRIHLMERRWREGRHVPPPATPGTA